MLAAEEEPVTIMTDKDHSGVVEKLIGHRFKDKGLLVQALSHSSYVNENPSAGGESNERMEFLGDSVLGFIITQYLYRHHPNRSEGELTLMKSVLVSEGTLARIAKGLDLGKYLYLGKGELSSGGIKRASNLSNALEAILGAVYLDGGMTEAKRVTIALFENDLKRIEANRHTLNYKNLLQTYSQEHRDVIPDYVLLESRGPQHGKVFKVEVKIKGEALGRGSGRTKKQAEQEAARVALKSLGKLE